MDSSRLDEPAGDSTTQQAAQAESEPVKESIAREQLLEVSRRIDGEDAPSSRGTELVLMDVDPRKVHAYWNIDEGTLGAATRQAGDGAQFVLRVSDVTDGHTGRGARTFDVDVRGAHDQCEVDLWQPGRAYVATLGLLGRDGSLVSLASSNVVQTPQPYQSGTYETTAVATHLRAGDGQVVVTDLSAHVMAATEPAPEILPMPIPTAEALARGIADIEVVDPWSVEAVQAVRDALPPSENPPSSGALGQVPTSAPPAPGGSVPPSRPWPSALELAEGLGQDPQGLSWPSPSANDEAAAAAVWGAPTVELPPGAPAPKQFADFSNQASLELACQVGGRDEHPTDISGLSAAASLGYSTERLSSQGTTDWPSAEDLSSSLGASVSIERVGPLGSHDAGWSEENMAGVSASGASHAHDDGHHVGACAAASTTGGPSSAGAPAGAAAGQGLMPPVPLENFVQLSSFELGTQNVWLEVHTELLIHGRAKPGTELLLYGQKVQVRPDGTFAIRRPLPQGALVLPLLFSGTAGA